MYRLTKNMIRCVRFNTVGGRLSFMEIAKTILTVLEIITSVVMVLVVMFQSGKEAGLSGALSGNSDSYLSKSGKSLDKQLASATKWVALVWLVLTLALCLLP